MTRLGVIVLGHGSREPSANQEFEDFVARYALQRPDLCVEPGYLELATPSLREALGAMAQRVSQIVVLPLLLFAAGHVKNDLPLALAAARSEYPRVRFAAAEALGVHPLLVALALDRLATQLAPGQSSENSALLVVGRGSSDPDANAEFCKLVRLVAEARKLDCAIPTFIGITRPLFEEAVSWIARTRPQRLLVLPYFLFGGRLIQKLGEQVQEVSRKYPWIDCQLLPHLGADSRLFALLDERLTEATEGRRPLACDTCQYRVPISGVTENVGGLRALLWSIRHSLTHTQAMPHRHAHKPLRKHVLVCCNADCAASGSLALLAKLRRSVLELGLEPEVRITRTGCMGRCGEGPTVAVYPDGIWYRGVRESDAEELVTEHLIGERLVARLVDSIMQ